MTRAVITDNKDFVINRLKELAKGKKMDTSYWIAKNIEEKGLIKASYAPNPAGRGRTIKIYDLTTKGKRMVQVAMEREAKEKAERKLIREAKKLIQAQKKAEAVKQNVKPAEEKQPEVVVTPKRRGRPAKAAAA